MILQLQDVHANYGKSRVLHGVNFNVDRAQIVSLIGRNGVGRSTTLKAIMGLVDRPVGSIWIADEDVTKLRSFEIARRGIAYVPEEREVFHNLTVEQNLILGRQAPRSGAATWTIAEMYEFFPRLAERKNAFAGTMSGGEQQMLTLCRSLLGNPRVILIDEPTEGLAPLIVERLVDVIQEISNRGVAVVLVEQKMTIALAISSRVDVMGYGQIVFSGTPDELRGNAEVQRRWLEASGGTSH